MDLSGAWRRIEAQLNGLIASLPNLVFALLVFGLFYLAARQLKKLVFHLTRGRRHARNVGLVLGRIAQGAIVLVGVLVALSIVLPDFETGQVIEVLGIGSVAIGFAFRDIFQNFLAGILLLLTEPFGIGDQIVVNEFEGTIEDIQARATFIRTYDGRRVVIPNADLFTQSVIVNTAYASRRSEYDVPIGHSDDLEHAQALILAALEKVDGVLHEPPPDVFAVDLAESSVNLRARWWTQPRRGEVVATQGRVLAAIKTTLDEHGIDLPFPTRQILFHDQTEETDGDRARQREGWRSVRGAQPRPRSIAGALQRLGAERAAGKQATSDNDGTSFESS